MGRDLVGFFYDARSQPESGVLFWRKKLEEIKFGDINSLSNCELKTRYHSSKGYNKIEQINVAKQFI